jgi:enterochelin esterase-like enzyme
VDVWLPDDYSTSNQRYPVLYMHDGQMLFDSTHTWNHQEWGMDETAGKLIQERKTIPFIIVGIWNDGETRHADYFPQKPFEQLTDSARRMIYSAIRQNGADVFKGKKIISDGYLKFLVTELKPFIDKTYRTKSNRKNTFVAGSSMGGLISLYAICEYPDVFGGAACLSTHWPGIFTMENNPIPDAFFVYINKHIPSPSSHRIYFDCGTETLDALYPPLQKKADSLIMAKRYHDKNFMSQVFTGTDHSERSWKSRMHIPLIFLLGKKSR